MKTLIKHLMSRQVVVASTDHKFSQVMEFFAKFSVHHIPVTKDDEVLGIISAKDVIKNFYNFMVQHNYCFSQEQLDSELSLAGIMTPKPMTIKPDDTLEHAAEIFTQHRFHALPVVENGKVQGIITTKDIAKEILLNR